MENTQPTKTAKGYEKKADTSDDTIKSRLVAVTEKPASNNLLSTDTTATTQNATRKIAKSVDFRKLKSILGLVAGALSDFNAAGGLVVVKEEKAELPSGTVYALKFYLVAKGAKIIKRQTADGVEFDLVAEEK